MKLTLKLCVVVVTLASSVSVWAHGETEHKSSAKKQVQSLEETAFGRPGDRKKVNRTIHVAMLDEMHFVASGSGAKRPGKSGGSDEIRLQQGDVVRFVVANKGKAMHEMVIGTMPDLKQHAELMRKHPGMEHDEAYMAHVAPGKTGEIVWQFTQSGEFHYACLVAGHFEAGMIGKIVVDARKSK